MAIATLTNWEFKLAGYLNAGIADEDSTTSMTAVFYDEDLLTARTPDSASLVFVLDPLNTLGIGSEIIKAASHSTASGVTTLATVTRGLARTGYSLSAVSANSKKWPAKTPIGIATHHHSINTINYILNGTIGTGAANLRVGIETNVDITLYAQNADANKPYLRYDADANTTGAWVISHDGSTDIIIDGAGGVFTATSPIDITASVVSLTLASNPALEDSTGLRLKVLATGGILRGANGAYIDQSADFDPTWLGTHQFSDIRINEAVQLTSTSTELNRLDGIGAGVTAVNLSTLTTGATTDGGALHKHLTIHGTGARTGVTGSGTQNIVHGLGRIPTFLWIYAFSNATMIGAESTGTATGTGDEQCSYIADAEASADVSSGNVIYLVQGANSWAANITVWDATNITLNFTLANVPGDMKYIYIVW